MTLFGELKYEPMSYSYLQIKQLSAIFNENIMYFDYNQSKSSPSSIQFNPETTYVLKVKDKFTILYVRQPKIIEILEEGLISLNEVENIFSGEQRKMQKTEEVGFFDKILGSNKSDNKEPTASKLFPDQI